MANLTDDLFGGWGGSSGLSKLNTMLKEQQSRLEINEVTEISNDLNRIYLWVLFAIGFPANIVIVITIVGMKVMSPATVFVVMLAIFDGLALTAKLIGHQLFMNGHFHGHQGTVLCKMAFITNFSSTTANWMLALICFERFISVCYPLKKVYLLTKKRCFIAVAAITITFLIFFGLMFGIMRKLDNKQGQCTTEKAYYDFWKDWWDWISVSLYQFIPFLLIIAFTAPIIRGLIVSRKQRRSMVLKNSESGRHNVADLRLLSETERTEKMITIMLIVAAIVFLILTIPTCVYHLMDASYTYSSKLSLARFKLFGQVSYLMADASHAVNFFLYFFTAKRFRTFALQLFCPCLKNSKSCSRICRKEEENSSGVSKSTMMTKITSERNNSA